MKRFWTIAIAAYFVGVLYFHFGKKWGLNWGEALLWPKYYIWANQPALEK